MTSRSGLTAPIRADSEENKSAFDDASSDLNFENQMDNFVRTSKSRLTVVNKQSRTNLDFLANNVLSNIKMRKSMSRKKGSKNTLAKLTNEMAMTTP